MRKIILLIVVFLSIATNCFAFIYFEEDNEDAWSKCVGSGSCSCCTSYDWCRAHSDVPDVQSLTSDDPAEGTYSSIFQLDYDDVSGASAESYKRGEYYVCSSFSGYDDIEVSRWRAFSFQIPRHIITHNFQGHSWTDRGSNVWYVQKNSGDPYFSTTLGVTDVWVADVAFAEETVFANLGASEFYFGDQDSLGYDTVYIYSVSDPTSGPTTIETNFQPPVWSSAELIIHQLQSGFDSCTSMTTNPIMAIGILPDGRLRMQTRGANVTCSSSWTNSSSDIIINEIEEDVWYRIIYNYRLSYSGTGYYYVWINGSPVVSRSGMVNTVYNTEETSFGRAKLGLYTWYWKTYYIPSGPGRPYRDYLEIKYGLIQSGDENSVFEDFLISGGTPSPPPANDSLVIHDINGGFGYHYGGTDLYFELP